MRGDDPRHESYGCKRWYCIRSERLLVEELDCSVLYASRHPGGRFFRRLLRQTRETVVMHSGLRDRRAR